MIELKKVSMYEGILINGKNFTPLVEVDKTPGDLKIFADFAQKTCVFVYNGVCEGVNFQNIKTFVPKNWDDMGINMSTYTKNPVKPVVKVTTKGAAMRSDAPEKAQLQDPTRGV